MELGQIITVKMLLNVPVQKARTEFVLFAMTLMCINTLKEVEEVHVRRQSL